MEYEQRKEQLLKDSAICPENRKLYANFFEKQEYKSLRTNNLSKLDHACQHTLSGYITKIKNINKWFNNKPLTKLTEADIKRVYDGLENGTIKTERGKEFKDRKSYYNKVFKSKLFEMAGKADIAREVMEFFKPNDNQTVRFVKEEDVRKLESVAIRPDQKALIWLAFDIGENIQSGLLQLKKKNFTRQQNEATREPEYRVNLPQEILKRSRTARCEITNYPETVQFLDMILRNLKDEDNLFKFEYRQAVKFFDRAVKLSGIKVEPTGDDPTWKDLRSGMACDLVRKGFSRDEVNARLGHRPSSSEIDKYINYFAMDRHKPKQKVHQHKLTEISEELERSKERERLLNTRIETMNSSLEQVKAMVREYVKVQAPDLLEKSRVELKAEARELTSRISRSRR